MSLRLDPLLKNRSALFWTLQVGGWLGFVISQYLGTLLYEHKSENLSGYLTVIVVAATSGFLLSLELRYIYRRLWLSSPRVIIFGALLACYLFALVWRVIINSGYLTWTMEAMEWDMKSPLEFFSNALASTYLLLCWTGLYFGFKYYESLQEQREATLRAATLAQEAQLKMLRYQLNPHFLFNTLNSISTLVLLKQTERANAMLARLSSFLRYTLANEPTAKVTLAQEVETLKLYLEIEKMRFEDRLRPHFRIESETIGARLPSLLLQPLIENAIKYAVTPSENGADIWITATREGQAVRIEVADNGNGDGAELAASPSTGVGLANIRDRLSQAYGASHRFQTRQNEKGGFSVILDIPLETGETI